LGGSNFERSRAQGIGPLETVGGRSPKKRTPESAESKIRGEWRGWLEEAGRGETF